MTLDFRAAIRYPFTGSNLFHAWLVPGALVLFLQMLSFALMLLVRHYSPLLSDAQLALMLSPFTILVNILLGGFLWHVCGLIKAEGPHALLPAWRSSIGLYLRDGAKLFLYTFLVNLILNFLLNLPGLNLQARAAEASPVLIISLLLVTAVFFVPVLVAPVVQAPPDYRLKSLFNFPKAIQLLKAHYKQGLVAMLMTLPIFVVYSVLIALLILSRYGVVLIPFVIIAMLVTIWHLLTQGLTEHSASWPESGDLRLGT